MPRLTFFLVLACFMSGCVELPTPNDDLLRAEDTRDPRGHLDLLRRQGEAIAGVRFIPGNKADLLRDGAATYPAMLAAIGRARHRIDMESYTFEGSIAEKFAEALLRRRAAGVGVNLIYDAWGSSGAPPELFDRLRAGGVRVVEYNPVDLASLFDFSANDRDHRKMLVLDGRIAFTGGVNVSNVYKRKLKKILPRDDGDDVDEDKLPWRDTEVRIEGPVVAEFERLFMQTWREQNGPPLPPLPSTPATPRGGLFIQAIDDTPELHRAAIYRSILMAIALAHSSVHLTAAYFVPTPGLVRELKAAARRGVDVTMLLPSRSTSDFALKAGRASYEGLMRAGVKIYEREGVILHAKTAVIDGLWSTVGSSNLDWRSVVFNNECNAVILGANFGAQMEAMFGEDLAQSKRIDPQKWKERSFWEALDEWKARLLEVYL